jgi:hypothetical protein
MDFIIGLPMYEGNIVVMVVVDWFTKYAHFFSLSHPLRASKITTTLWKEFIR